MSDTSTMQVIVKHEGEDAGIWLLIHEGNQSVEIRLQREAAELLVASLTRALKAS